MEEIKGGYTNKIMRRHTNEYLVQNGRDGKHGKTSRLVAPPPGAHRRVHMSFEVLIHGLIPRAPVHAQALAVPPLVVEGAVGEPRHLGQGVEEGLEEGKEARQPDDERNGGQLEQTLYYGRDVEGGDLVERVAQDGRGVLGACEPDEDAEAEDLAETL